MKKLLSFLMFFENILNWIKKEYQAEKPTIKVAWSIGDLKATVTLTFPNISVMTDTMLAALKSFIEAHESLVDYTVNGNEIIITVTI